MRIFTERAYRERLFEEREKTEKEKEYKKLILKSDFLLPDGIALQIYYYCANLFGVIKSDKKWLPNLN